MRFRMLGPLEVVDGDQPVALGGIRQRATLGFLLLHANRVVASSQLVHALWAVGQAPSSARKILQNAVWRLRGVLTTGDGVTGSVALLSQAPGYMLRVAPDQADLYNFQRLVERGRSELSAGSPEAATRLLQDALGLWRGPVLADLVETGIAWPELTSVQNARLDAMEDYFEAELACGRHHQILAAMETMVATEPLRERLCSQLMLGLYRCGRQTDALNVYYSVRNALVDKLGLEPGRALQSLQQAILSHDPVLIPAAIRQQIELRMTGVPVEAAAAPAEPAITDRCNPDGTCVDDNTVSESPAIPLPRTVIAERKDVSILIARTQLSAEFGGIDPEKIDEVVENAATAIREEVERFGGTVAASIGSIWLALFGVPGNRADDAERAVRAALTIRERVSTLTGPEARTVLPSQGVAVQVQVAVATGEAVVRYQPDYNGIPPSVNGTLLDECHSLLSLTSAGEIRVCDDTRRSTEPAVTYLSGDSSAGWQVGGFRPKAITHHAVPLIDRESELEVLRSLLQRTRHRSTPHLVTVLGEPGIGKTRLIMEFERRVAANPEVVVRSLVGRIQPCTTDGDPLAVLNDVLSSCCGVRQGDSAETARAKLTGTIQRLVESEEERCWLQSCLSPLIDPEGCPSQVGVNEVLAAWRHFLGEIATAGPLVVIIEDLHCADDVMIDFVASLTKAVRSVPLLVIATAGPELLTRRPGWGGGVPHNLMLTLDPISDAAIDRLLEFLMSTMDSDVHDPASGLLGTILANVSDEPDVRRSHMRRILASGSARRLDGRGVDVRGVNGHGGSNGTRPVAPPVCTPRSSGYTYR